MQNLEISNRHRLLAGEN